MLGCYNMLADMTCSSYVHVNTCMSVHGIISSTNNQANLTDTEIYVYSKNVFAHSPWSV